MSTVPETVKREHHHDHAEGVVGSGPTTIRAFLLNQGELTEGGLELVDAWFKDPTQTIWVDIEGTDPLIIEPLLETRFGFHELASEDSLSPTTLPKYDSFDKYDFLIFRALDMNFIEHGVETLKLAAFLGPKFLITVHHEPLVSVSTVTARLPRDRRVIERGPDFVLYTILDVLVDLHFPLLEEIEQRVDDIQHLIFTKPSPSLLDELLHLKKDLNMLRRYSLPQRELFNQLSRGDAKTVQREHLIYFRDLYDHMFRISESIDVERDLLGGTMEAYLSVIANRTNEIMKVLTIFSSILLPMNFIAGVYGMNFEHMPELGWQYGYAVALGMMALVAFVLVGYFTRKGWLFAGSDERPSRGYKRVTWPARYVRVAAKRAGAALKG